QAGPDDAVALRTEAEAGEAAVEDRDSAEGAHVGERATVDGELRQLTERGHEPAAELEADRERWLAIHVDAGDAGVVDVDDADPVAEGDARAVGEPACPPAPSDLDAERRPDLRRRPVEPVRRAIGPVVEHDGPAVPGVKPLPRARDTQTCHPPTPWRPCGPDSLRLSAGIVSLPACLCTSVSPRTRKSHARVGRELLLEVHLRPGSAIRLPAIGHQAGWVPPALDEAPVQQHLAF